MSISIYYEAKRNAPLSAQENAAIAAVIKRYSVEDQIREYVRSGRGQNWESFHLYGSSSSADSIFSGATKLPDNSEEAIWIGVQHWCAALSEIRRILHGATWEVSVDDHPIRWDEQGRRYDPST